MTQDSPRKAAACIFVGAAGALTLILSGQQVATMYNYVQPIIASVITVLVGLDTFGLMKSIAVALVFLGVFIVTRSKSKAQMEKQETTNR